MTKAKSKEEDQTVIDGYKAELEKVSVELSDARKVIKALEGDIAVLKKDGVVMKDSNVIMDIKKLDKKKSYVTSHCGKGYVEA